MCGNREGEGGVGSWTSWSRGGRTGRKGVYMVGKGFAPRDIERRCANSSREMVRVEVPERRATRVVGAGAEYWALHVEQVRFSIIRT